MKERKPIDGALRRYLDEQAAALGVPAAMTDEERTRTVRQLMSRSLESRTFIPGLPNDVEMSEVEIAAGLGARVYKPAGTVTSLPMLVYLHGGGWLAGSVTTADPFCRLLTAAAGVMVASIDYRLAPEHLFPAALEDAVSAVHWAAEHAGEWGGDAERLVLGGDSAGANLAAVAANRLFGGEDFQRLRALLLLYPVTDHPSANHRSYAENASGFGLEANAMRWFWEKYAPGVSPDDPDISPLRIGRVPALPPTLVATAEYDVLRDEGIAYAERLERAGVAVTRMHAPDMHHNFPVSPGTVGRFSQCMGALGDMAGWLRETLAMSGLPSDFPVSASRA